MRVSVFLIFVVVAAFLSGCTAFQSITSFQKSPREIYAANLIKYDLQKSSMGKAWEVAGSVEDHDSIIVSLPFRETGFFPAALPQARFYRFDAKDGQVATVKINTRSRERARLFVDLFILKDSVWKVVAWADTTQTLSHEITKDEHCLIRVQPELLVNVFYTIELTATPALIIPVKGATNKSIGSFYNDSRNINGKIRKHEGVDIFAPKGTPVIAPVDGIVSRVGTNSLGGKVVWMNDPRRGQSYYFAHLDSQIAVPGTNVKQGDVLGTVGNTGNAKYTPSHLHFGVYQNSSKDPIAYLQTMDKLTGSFLPDTSTRGAIVRTNQKVSVLLYGPSKKALVRQSLPKDSWLQILGQAGDWYRVVTANQREGFIDRKKVISADKGNKFVLKKPTQLLVEARRDGTPEGMLTGSVEGLASYKTFRFIRTAQGQTGWIDLSEIL